MGLIRKSLVLRLYLPAQEGKSTYGFQTVMVADDSSKTDEMMKLVNLGRLCRDEEVEGVYTSAA